jgi:hypothetical protein
MTEQTFNVICSAFIFVAGYILVMAMLSYWRDPK